MRDIDIRRELKAEAERIHAHEPETRIVDELGLRQGAVRVDVAVINGYLHGYEIKSAADTLRRLPRQLEVYSEVLDFASIVVSWQHLAEASHLLPAWWGILQATPTKGAAGRLEFTCVRPNEPNPSINPRALAELLWHDEALELLRLRGADKGVRGKPRRYAWDRVVEVLPLAELRHAVRDRLKDRERLRAAAS